MMPAVINRAGNNIIKPAKIPIDVCVGKKSVESFQNPKPEKRFPAKARPKQYSAIRRKGENLVDGVKAVAAQPIHVHGAVM
jgi:hypothetical protein